MKLKSYEINGLMLALTAGMKDIATTRYDIPRYNATIYSIKSTEDNSREVDISISNKGQANIYDAEDYEANMNSLKGYVAQIYNSALKKDISAEDLKDDTLVLKRIADIILAEKNRIAVYGRNPDAITGRTFKNLSLQHSTSIPGSHDYACTLTAKNLYYELCKDTEYITTISDISEAMQKNRYTLRDDLTIINHQHDMLGRAYLSHGGNTSKNVDKLLSELNYSRDDDKVM